MQILGDFNVDQYFSMVRMWACYALEFQSVFFDTFVARIGWARNLGTAFGWMQP